VTEPDPANYVWWLAARSAGIVAFLLIAAAVIIGLFLSSDVSRRPGLKRDLVKVHQQVALAALATIAAHGILLLGDKWLNAGVTGITIPFTIAYRPVWTGLGILAGYLAVALGPTFYLRRRIGARRWRLIHRFTVLVYALAVVHSLGSGTDGGSLWFTAVVIATAVPITALLALRLRPKASRRAKAHQPRPTPTARATTSL
jgi:methionine sulfoxide reductase heme-binding subunit